MSHIEHLYFFLLIACRPDLDLCFLVDPLLLVWDLLPCYRLAFEYIPLCVIEVVKRPLFPVHFLLPFQYILSN